MSTLMKPLVGKIIKTRYQEAGESKSGKKFDAFWAARITLGEGVGAEVIELTKPAAKLPDGIKAGQLVIVEEFIPTEGTNSGVVTKFFTLLD